MAAIFGINYTIYSTTRCSNYHFDFICALPVMLFCPDDLLSILRSVFGNFRYRAIVFYDILLYCSSMIKKLTEGTSLLTVKLTML